MLRCKLWWTWPWEDDRGNDRDTDRYELRDRRGRVLYVGITNNVDRRENAHRNEGKRFFDMYVMGPKVTRESAERWEEERLASYRRNHGGKNPRYNEQGR